MLFLRAGHEFSDYNPEGFGWASWGTRLAGRSQARRRNFDFQRVRLDQSDKAAGGARPWPRYLQSIIRSPGRCGLGNYRRRSSVSRFYRKTEHRDGGRRACADNRSNPSAEAGITSDAWHTSAQPAPRPTCGRSRAIFRCCIDFLVQTEIGRAERD